MGWLVLVMALLWPTWQSWLGRTVVQALDGRVRVEVCTAGGMQWVAVEDAPQGEASASGLQPCVWAAGHAPLALGLGAGLAPLVFGPVQAPLPPLAHSPPAGVGPHVRALLMAPMRAPPART